MCMLWNFSALEYSRCLAIPRDCSLSVHSTASCQFLNPLLHEPAWLFPFSIPFLVCLNCLLLAWRVLWQLTSRPPHPLPGSCSALISPAPFPQLWRAGSTPSRTSFAHDSRCLNSVWTSPMIFRLAGTTRNSQPKGRPPLSSYLYLARQAWHSRLKEKRIDLRSDGCLWKGNGLAWCVSD